MSKHLTDSERLHIVKEYLGSTRSKYAIEKKYNIAQGLIKDWLRKFGLEYKILPEQTMEASPNQGNRIKIELSSGYGCTRLFF